MRPEILFPLFAPVTALKGLGARLGRLVEKAAGPQVVDLIWHVPTGLIDRRFAPKLAEAEPGQIVTLTVTIEAHFPPGSSRMPYRVRASDGTGTITLTFFRARGDYLEKVLPVGSERVISGKLESYNDQLQMSHPDHIGAAGEVDLAIEPVYGLTAGLSLRMIRKAVQAALERVPALPEWQDAALLQRRGWPGWNAALAALHNPEGPEDLAPERPARQRLAYDEIFADQLALALTRAHAKRQPGRSIRG